MHACLEALKGKYVEVALTHQTLHGVLCNVSEGEPIFLLLEESDRQKIWVNLQHVVTLRTVTSLDKEWQRDAYY